MNIVGYTKLKGKLMVVLSVIKLIWLLEVLLSKLVLIIQKHLDMWLNQL
jgi:hypothetical protein